MLKLKKFFWVRLNQGIEIFYYLPICKHNGIVSKLWEETFIKAEDACLNAEYGR